MQIRQFLAFFEPQTHVIVKRVLASENGQKEYIPLMEVTLRDLDKVSQYFNSILDVNIKSENIAISGGTLHIYIKD